MKKFPDSRLSSLFALFLLTACATATPVAVTPTPQPTPIEVQVLPTPASPGNSISYQGLQVTMAQTEINDSFITEYDSQRVPSPGLKYLWVHVQLKNTGPDQIDIPVSEHFSVLYAAAELKATYGHRKDYADYTALGSVLFPNQEVDAFIPVEQVTCVLEALLLWQRTPQHICMDNGPELISQRLADWTQRNITSSWHTFNPANPLKTCTSKNGSIEFSAKKCRIFIYLTTYRRCVPSLNTGYMRHYRS